MEEDIITVPALQLINSIWNPVVSSRGFWTIVVKMDDCSDGPIVDFFFAQILYLCQGKIEKILMWRVYKKLRYINLIIIKKGIKAYQDYNFNDNFAIFFYDD